MPVHFWASWEQKQCWVKRNWTYEPLNPWPSVHRSNALTTELQRIHDELGYIQGWCMTCLLRTARISISLMILAVYMMHVIYESCIWSSSPHNTNTSATVSHISNSILGSKFWLVLQKPQHWNRVICFCAYPFNYQIRDCGRTTH